MKLAEIKPLVEARKSISQLQDELDIVRKKYSAWRRDNSIKSNTDIPHHLEGQKRRFTDTISAYNVQIKTAKENEQTDDQKKETTEFNQKLATRKDDKKATKERQGKALGTGIKNAEQWVAKHGGYTGAAKELEKIAKTQTRDGQEPFDAQAIADKIGITKGSVLRWINTRPEFKSMKRYTHR